MKSILYFINFKRIHALIVLICLLFCCVSCNNTKDNEKEKIVEEITTDTNEAEVVDEISGDVLQMNLNADITTLNPLMIKNEELLTIMMTVFEPAIRLSSEGTFVPSVIQSWNVDITGLIYTFTLNDDVYFHDKSLGKVTAYDLKSEIELLQSADYSESLFAAYADCISYIEVLSDTVLQVHTLNPTQDIMYFMTFPVLPMEIYKNSDYGIDSMSKPIGTGPFEFEEISTDGVLKLVRNESYRKGVAEIKKITAKPYQDEASALLDFQKQKINFALTSFINAKTICTNSDTLMYSSSTNKFDCLLPTNSSKTKDDVKLRQIVASCIDRKQLITNTLGGMGVSCYTPIKPGLTATRSIDYEKISDENIKSYFYEKGYLKTNGMYLDESGNEFTIKIAYYESDEVPYRSRIISEISNQLKSYGIAVISNKLSQEETVAALLADEYDFIFLSFNMKQNNDISFLFSGNYLSVIDDTEVYEAVLKLKNSVGEDKYNQQLLELYKILLDDMPVIGLYFRTYLMFLDDDYSSVHAGNYLDMLSDINTWRINSK